MKTCSSCGAEILFVEMESGKRMPVDPAPLFQAKAGMIYWPDAEEHEIPTAKVMRKATIHQPHWATCPDADRHRKPT